MDKSALTVDKLGKELGKKPWRRALRLVALLVSVCIGTYVVVDVGTPDVRLMGGGGDGSTGRGGGGFEKHENRGLLRAGLTTLTPTRVGQVKAPPQGPFCAKGGGGVGVGVEGGGGGGGGGKDALDKDFYTKYQSGVLASRKPFALDKGFFAPVEEYHRDKKLWLDAGAGTCGTMREIARTGHSVYGVELSDVCKTECAALARQGKVFSTGLNEIPFPDRHFDLVWSSEVFEHVPTHLINQSVAEVVRVAKRDMFFSIAMKRSGFDPDPPAKPKIHLSVLPRTWWGRVQAQLV